MQVIRHGHSFVEIETNKGSILIDPYITENPKCDITLEDLYKKNILAIFLTHGHGDHVGDTTDIVKHSGCSLVCEYWVGEYFEKEHNIDAIVGSIWWTVYCDDISIKFFHAFHGSWVVDNSLPYKCMPAWLLIGIEGKYIYHAWDTSLTYDMKLLWEYHKVDVAFVPIWDIYTMWVEDWARAVGFIKPEVAVPIHFDTRKKLRVDAIEWARLVMKDTKSVPKVLKPWQYVVIE